MQRKVSLGASIAVLVAAVILTALGTVMAYKTWAPAVAGTPAEETGTPSEDEIDVAGIAADVEEIKELIDKYYVGEYDHETVENYALIGMVTGLGDRHGGYYDAEGYAALMSDLDGDMQGIGISVIYNGERHGIEVIDVFPDSPAMKADLRIGDVIVYCGEDYRSVTSLGYEAALAALRGKAGTTAVFIAERGDTDIVEIPFSIVREKIVETSVRYRVYTEDPTVGIIKISTFNSATVTQFNDALEALKAEGVKKLVFDVRNNPGGELKSICSILDTLLPEGPVIRLIDKNGTETVYYKSDAAECDMPMAVIANGSTASAAELFTAALKDYGKASFVGTQTYGKGSMQSMFPLKNGGCLKLTTALYCPPFSDNYDGVGITPDVEVTLSEEASKKSIYKLTDNEDDQLTAAVKTFDKSDNK